MVTIKKEGKAVFYLCDACDFAYRTRELAEKCQDWCERYNTCNLEITQQAVPPEEMDRDEVV